MNQIHTSYKVSKMLKEFLGKDAPVPMDGVGNAFDFSGNFNVNDWRGFDCWRYQLHDLLSRPFCEAFNRKFVCESNIEKANPLLMSNIAHAYYYGGGMEAVEKALMEMKEGK